MTTRFRNMLALVFCPLLSIFSTASTAWWGMECCDCFELSPYIGYDVQVRHIEMPSSIDAGGKLFKHEYPANNIYAGLRFCDYVGLEAGYNVSATRTKTGVVNSGDQRFDVNPTLPSELWVSKAQYKSWHGDLLGFLPFCFMEAPFDLLGSVGFARLHTSHQSNAVGDNAGPVDYATNGYTFKKAKTIAKLGIGVQCMICDAYGIRLKVDWENTARVKQIGSLEHRPTEANFAMLFRNSQIYSLGAFFLF